VHAWRLSLTY